MHVGSTLEFPEELCKYGLNEALLAQVFSHVKDHKKGLIPWNLKGSAELYFYREMHKFLHTWPLTHSATKATIGRFYIAIDRNLQIKRYTPNNTYLFIERMVKSPRLNEETMTYGMEKFELIQVKEQLQDCAMHIQQVTEEFTNLKKELAKTKKKLSITNNVLEDKTNKLKSAELKCATAVANCTKVSKFHAKYASVVNENLRITEELEDHLQDLLNPDITEDFFTACEELSNIKDSDSVTLANNSIPRLRFKIRCNGTKYTPAIRKLYYSLLSEQIPPGKIATIIKTILKSFIPDLNTYELALPKEQCAGYMRIDELSTVSEVHKASIISKNVQDSKAFHLNTDGTTLAQKKLNSVAINNNVVSVNELHDGTAESVINDISKELQKLRKVAVALNLPNANSINWTLFSQILLVFKKIK